MITFGCAGFPVPATRYFKEFLFVEVPDIHVANPGAGTIRRWRREAPPGFAFSVCAPKDIGQEGFRDGKLTTTALQSMTDVGKDLDAQIGVFAAPPDFAPSRANKAAVKEFLGGVKRRFKRVVFDPPAAWDADEAQAIAADSGATSVRDPLASGTTAAPFAYYRLPGPAGHKSRYEDPAIEKLGEIAGAAKHEHAIYVFANVDMFADAKRLRKVMGLE